MTRKLYPSGQYQFNRKKQSGIRVRIQTGEKCPLFYKGCYLRDIRNVSGLDAVGGDFLLELVPCLVVKGYVYGSPNEVCVSWSIVGVHILQET